jgi:hypothetical protein
MTDNAKDSKDDAESMRLAFEQFMLSGGNNNKAGGKKNDNNEVSSVATPQSASSNKSKKKKKKKRPSTGAASSPKVVASPSTPMQTPATPKSSSSASQSTLNRKNKKRYYQILRSFNDKVKHTWMDIDGQLLSVMQNIVNIRGRLPPEWKLLSQAMRHETTNDGASPERKEKLGGGGGIFQDDWKSYGYREKSKDSSQLFPHLRIEDIQLALTHDLDQHEKMLAGLRSLMSNLAECHDGLGRIVDTLWQFHLECSNEEYSDDKEGNEDLENIVNCVTSTYQMLSIELYRKQNVVPTVIDSTQDDILGIGEIGVARGTGGTNSKKLVQNYCDVWKRSPVDEELLLNVMELGEP